MRVGATNWRNTKILIGGMSAFGSVVASVVLVLTFQVGEFSGLDRWVLSLAAGAISILASTPLLVIGISWYQSVKWIPAVAILIYVVSLNAWSLAFDELFVRVLASAGSEGTFNYRELIYTHLVDEGGGIPAFGIGANTLLASSLRVENFGALFRVIAVSGGVACLLCLFACVHVLGWSPI
jgi:hypothetical protein